MKRRKPEDTEAAYFKLMDDDFHIVMRAGVSSILIVVKWLHQHKVFFNHISAYITIVARRPLQSITHRKEVDDDKCFLNDVVESTSLPRFPVKCGQVVGQQHTLSHGSTYITIVRGEGAPVVR